MKPINDDKVRGAWEAGLERSITDEQWAKCCTVTQEVSLNNRHKLLHFKFLRRIYFTPAMTHKIDPSKPHNYRKCSAPQADFAHLTWTCLKLQHYWERVHYTLGQMINLPLIPTPVVALLGYTVNFPKKIRRFASLGLLLAKREVAVHWGRKSVPTVQNWLHSLAYCNVNSEVYASVMPSTSQPKDILGPYRSYIETIRQASSSQLEQGIIPEGVG